MNKRIGMLIILVLLLAVLFLPAAKLNVHSSVDSATAAAFPEKISLLDILLKGSASLPVETVSQMNLVQTGQVSLAVGFVLLLLACIAGLITNKRGALQLSMALGGFSCALLFSFASQLANTASSLLFGYLISTQFWVYVPAALALITVGLSFLALHGEVKACGDRCLLPVSDTAWRKIGAIIAIIAVLCVLLPFITVSVPDTITESVSAKTLNRSVSVLDYALDREDTLNAAVVAAGESTDVLTGDIGVLNPYSNQSASNNNIKYIFQNPKSATSVNALMLISVITLILGALLAFIKKADRWFAVCLHAVAAVCALGAALSMINVSSADFYSKAGMQLVYLGLGRITSVPLIIAVLAICAFLCGATGIRRADLPYFVNPLPATIRIRVIAVGLAVVAVVMMFMPTASFTFYKAGGTNTVSSCEITGVQLFTFSYPDDVIHPKDKKGNTMYEEEPSKEGVLSSTLVESSMKTVAVSGSVCTWCALILTLGGIGILLANRPRKLAIIAFEAAFLVRAVQWLLLILQTNSAIGEVSGTLYLYISMPVLVFAGFFSAFVHLDQLPKKYRLFLMLLPFLVSVFLFSYLPLAGWRYAFYNYKFGKPWSQQEFVAFKWFKEMFTNAGHFTNIVRVMKNTLGMSLLGLAFSWLPMFFAIFLNEINSVRFRKFVQIFTTLPNFISWALVFSFAMAMFSMETGIFSKFMLAIGAIDQPVAWLNSGEHIWLKMWAWGTWKGLGWSAIMYLAAIAGIDQEMYEAAKVDGANRGNIIRHITLPSLLPTFFVLLLLSISNIINNGMEQYLVFQNAMNKESIEVLDLYVYNITIASGGTTMYSFGTAIGILKTIVSVTLLFTANFASKKLRGESIV